MVERLLASPHYGERWARPWLDLARYADSNGYEKDNLRSAWPYRDYVISALNRDLSFRDFTIEQLAGDMLKDATVEQKIATGFHRNSQLNQEGGIDVEEARFETLVDRVSTTGSVWMGSTLGCAQCHNHKFDPFPQKDFYRLLAFYDNVEYSVFGQGEEVVDRWIVEPQLELPTPEQAERRAALRTEAEPLRFEIANRDLAAEIEAFAAQRRGAAPAWTPLEIAGFEAKSGAKAENLPDRSVLVKGEAEEKDTYTMTVRAGFAGATAFRLEALPDESLPKRGPGRAGSGAFVVTEIAVAEGGRPIALHRAGVDVVEKGRTPNHLVDGHLDTGWGVTVDGDLGKGHHAIVEAAHPAAGGALTFTLSFEPPWPHVRSSLGRFRLSATRSKNPWGGLPVSPEVQALLDSPAATRSPEQQQALLEWWRPLAFSLYGPAGATAADRPRARGHEGPDHPGHEGASGLRAALHLAPPPRELHEPGGAGLRGGAGGARIAPRGPAREPARSRAVAGERRQPPDRARHRQSTLGDPLRPRPRAHQRGLRLPGRASHPPGAARLAGRGVHGEGLEPEGDPADDRRPPRPTGSRPASRPRRTSAIPTTGCSPAVPDSGWRRRRCATWPSPPPAS